MKADTPLETEGNARKAYVKQEETEQEEETKIVEIKEVPKIVEILALPAPLIKDVAKKDVKMTEVGEGDFFECKSSVEGLGPIQCVDDGPDFSKMQQA